MEKCYKLHGYRSSYKPKSKTTQPKAQVNQASVVATDETGSAATDSLLGMLTHSQCQQLIAFLS